MGPKEICDPAVIRRRYRAGEIADFELRKWSGEPGTFRPCWLRPASIRWTWRARWTWRGSVSTRPNADSAPW